MNPNNKQMDPKDNRNLIIFMIISAVLYFAYDTFVMQPYETAVREARSKAQAQAQILKPEASKQAAKPKTAQDIIASAPHIAIENDKLNGAISSKGATLNHITLSDYYETMKKENPITVLSPKDTWFPRSINFGWVSADTSLKLPSDNTEWTISSEHSTLTPTTPVTLSWDNGEGLTFNRTFELDDQYLITVTQSVRNNGTNAITLHPYGLIKQKGLPQHYEGHATSFEGPIAYIGGELEKTKYQKIQKKRTQKFSGSDGWIAMTDKYWLTALMPAQSQNIDYRFNYVGTPPKKNQIDRGLYQTDFTSESITVAPLETRGFKSHIFTGPKKVLMLKDYSKILGVPKLDLSVDFGMFWFFTIPFFYCLHYLGLFLGNMGFAIIALTILIRLAASPLTYSSYKSFAKMKKVMPQVNALKEKYEDDRQKLQTEIMGLYQKEGVNPAAGCFPILLQIPIFFAFYKILLITIELRHAPFIGWIEDLAARDPTNVFNAFGLIPWDPPSFLHIGIWPCLMLVGMIIQKNINPPPTDKIQRDMMRLFPFIMTYIMAGFASGLVIYWTISAFFGNIQQIVIMRKMGVPIHLFGESHDDEEEISAASSKDEADAKPAKKPKDIEGKAEVIEDITPPKHKRKKKK